MFFVTFSNFFEYVLHINYAESIFMHKTRHGKCWFASVNALINITHTPCGVICDLKLNSCTQYCQFGDLLI